MKEVQELAQADTTGGSFADGDLKVLKEVLSDLQKLLDASIANGRFDDEQRAFAIHLVELMTSSVNVKVRADTDGQVYAPLGVGDGPRLLEVSEASDKNGEGVPAKVGAEQGGKKKKARKDGRRRQTR